MVEDGFSVIYTHLKLCPTAPHLYDAVPDKRQDVGGTQLKHDRQHTGRPRVAVKVAQMQRYGVDEVVGIGLNQLINVPGNE